MISRGGCVVLAALTGCNLVFPYGATSGPSAADAPAQPVDGAAIDRARADGAGAADAPRPADAASEASTVASDGSAPDASADLQIDAAGLVDSAALAVGCAPGSTPHVVSHWAASMKICQSSA